MIMINGVLKNSIVINANLFEFIVNFIKSTINHLSHFFVDLIKYLHFLCEEDFEIY